MPTFFQLASKIEGKYEVSGDDSVEITGVACDSREVKPGFVFVAIPGTKSDGHDFVDTAIANGAVAIVSQRPAGPHNFPNLVVPFPAVTLSALAAEFYDHPSRSLQVVGVTGTNGKTTIGFVLKHLLTQAQRFPGLIGTVRNEIGDREIESTHTTPDASAVQGLLREMADAGCRSVAMEVSSHALVQRRVDDIAFDVVIFTNLTQDHLDYHVTEEAYFQAKRRLFELATKDTTMVINGDDPAGARLLREFAHHPKILTYGLGASNDFRVSDFLLKPAGTEFTLITPKREIRATMPLIGRFNIYNALATLATAAALDLNLRESVRALSTLPQVPGRMENISPREPFNVFVDYAHTPDALENVLKTIRDLDPRRLICVFGCGGDRDQRKRSMMGEIADRMADVCIVTSDNPRTEDPASIIADIEVGMSKMRLVEPDREAAIRLAILHAEKGDVVLIAGKGHEDYQIIGTEKKHFDDREVARFAVNDRVRILADEREERIKEAEQRAQERMGFRERDDSPEREAQRERDA